MMWLFENAQVSHVQKPLGEWSIWAPEEDEEPPGQLAAASDSKG